MNEETAFMQAICESPADDTPRLIYADWLEESGKAEKSEFIRIQCQPCPVMTSLQGDGKPSDLRCGSCERCEREWRLVYPPGKSKDWFNIPNGILLKFASDQSNYSVPVAGVSRGFISHLRVEAEWFLRHADQLCWYPTQKIECHDCDGLGQHRIYIGYGDSEEADCVSCKGTGKQLRECPATAQPITQVKLTTWPDIDMEPEDVATSQEFTQVIIERKLKDRWSWIDFRLP